MNYIWSILLITSLVCGIITGRIEETLSSGLEGAASAVSVLFSFAGIMCFWSGILRVSEKSGLTKKCEKLLSGIISRLFPKTQAKSDITMNVVSNLFGLGNAATPSGISAMVKMDAENGESPYPSHEMSRFAVMNTASLQIIPTTVIGILSAAGAVNPYGIIPLIWISSSVSLACALLAEAFLFRRERRNKK